jgi:translation initiation factor eIF-2B subunit delta
MADASSTMDIRARIEAIAEDNTSGATALAARACDVLCAAAHDAAASGTGIEGVWEVGESLLAAQPAMVSIVNAVNAALTAAENAPELHMATAVRSRLDRLKRALQERPAAIADSAWRLLPERAVVMTHSFSSVVLRWLVEAHRRGHCAEAYCTESRPMCEGVALASRLTAEGVCVTLIADAAAAECVARVDAVTIGADGITPQGLVNKIGTYPLALAARRARVPVYVLCGSEKILGAGCIQPRLDDLDDPAELLPEPIPGVRVRNTYFELTPLSCVSAVLTESGAVAPSDLAALFQAVPVHHRLRAHRQPPSVGREP